MEERCFTTVECALRQGVRQESSEASTPCFRVRCDCAQLHVAGKPHALAGHRNETHAITDANIRPKLDRAEENGPGL